MPIATPALELGVVANANPPATSAIKRSFFMFYVTSCKLYQLNIKYDEEFLKLFESSRAIVFRITRHTNVGSDLFKSYPLEVRAVVSAKRAPPAKRDNWSAGQDRSDINLHLID